MIKMRICSIDELPNVLQTEKPDFILSVLDPAFLPPTCLQNTNAEKLLLNFHDIITPSSEKVAPGSEHVHAIKILAKKIKENGGGTVVVHCHGGISRSTAAATLLYGEIMGGTPQEWLDAVRQSRPRSWPNSRLLRLGCNASNLPAMEEALQKHYLRAGKEFPELIPMIKKRGRDEEIPATFKKPPIIKPT